MLHSQQGGFRGTGACWKTRFEFVRNSPECHLPLRINSTPVSHILHQPHELRFKDYSLSSHLSPRYKNWGTPNKSFVQRLIIVPYHSFILPFAFMFCCCAPHPFAHCPRTCSPLWHLCPICRFNCSSVAEQGNTSQYGTSNYLCQCAGRE